MADILADMRQKRHPAADWTSNNPTLKAGEIGVESDTGKKKIGDGATPWATLPYDIAAYGAADVEFDPSGLIVVTTDNVQAALAEVDARLARTPDVDALGGSAGDLVGLDGAGGFQRVAGSTYANEHVHVDLLAPPNSSATAGAPLVSQVSTLFFGGRQLWQSPTQNDEITYNVQLRAGTWTLALFHEAQSDVGIYHVEFDGTEVGTIDGYAAAAAATRSLLTGITVPATKVVAVSLVMATKNASSSGYRIRVSGMTLTRTGA